MIKYHIIIPLQSSHWKLPSFETRSVLFIRIAGLKALKSMFFDLKSAKETIRSTFMLPTGITVNFLSCVGLLRAKAASFEIVEVIAFQILYLIIIGM